MMLRTMVVVAALVLSAAVPTQADLTLELIRSGPIRVGDQLQARIAGDTAGAVIESDISQNSRQIRFQGETMLDLGRIERAGYYLVTARSGRQSVVLPVLALPAEGGMLEVQSAESFSNNAAQSSEDDLLVTRYLRGLSRERLVRALSQTWKPYLVENSVDLSTTAMVCNCPGMQVACGVGVAGHGVDFVLAVVATSVEDMVEDGVFSAMEGRHLKRALGILSVGSKMLTTSGNFVRLFDAAMTAIEVSLTDPNTGARLMLKFSAGEGRRIRVLIRALK